jgi:hypothetical protein
VRSSGVIRRGTTIPYYSYRSSLPLTGQRKCDPPLDLCSRCDATRAEDRDPERSPCRAALGQLLSRGIAALDQRLTRHSADNRDYR